MSLTKARNCNYSAPVKRIHDSQGLQSFQQSLVLRDLSLSLARIAESVENKEVPKGVLSVEDTYTAQEIEKYSHESRGSIRLDFERDVNDGSQQLKEIYERFPIVKSLVELLSKVSGLIDEIPPLEGPRRYGNFACRTWHDQLDEKMCEWLKDLIVDEYYKKENSKGFLEEIKWYILNAFGSKERLDYGTGHELNFLAFLTGLIKVDIIDDELDGHGLLVIFGNYYRIVMKLISTYTLEPAGSHGVWGLDDHFHIIYILGASQLLHSDKHEVTPKSIQNRSTVFKYSTKNLFFNSISFLFKVKKGPFFEHSPILYDISNVKDWEKVVSGLFKMFQVEVVGKFPVVQHFYFGDVLFPWVNAETGEPLPYATNDTDDDVTPTPSLFDEEEQPALTAAPWKSKKPKPFLQDSILGHSSTTRAPPANSTVNSNKSKSTGLPPTTSAPWAKR